ncbi:MAG: hypothetical protein ACREEB_11485 [Caulobacteraceae bacterium]
MHRLTLAAAGLLAGVGLASTAQAATLFYGITGEQHLNTYNLATGAYNDAQTIQIGAHGHSEQLVGLGEIGT